MACVEHDITFTCIYALVNKIILKKLRIQSWIRLCFQNICFKVLKLLSKLSKEFPQYNCITFLLLLSCYTSHIATLFSYSKNIFFPFFFFLFTTVILFFSQKLEHFYCLSLATVTCKTGRNLNLQWFPYLSASKKFL